MSEGEPGTGAGAVSEGEPGTGAGAVSEGEGPSRERGATRATRRAPVHDGLSEDRDLHLRHHSGERLPRLRRRMLVAGLVLLLLGGALTAVVAGSAVLQPLDDRFRELMVSWRWEPMVTVCKALSIGFGTMVLWPVRIAVTLVIAIRRRWAMLLAWVLTVVLSELLIGPVKALVDRPRPPDPLVLTSGASYPSGHAIASAVTLIGVVMALTTGRRRLHWMIGAVLLATAVALSRTYLSAHWLTDVVGGSLLGAGVALAVPEAVEVIRDRRLSRRGPSPRSTAAS